MKTLKKVVCISKTMPGLANSNESAPPRIHYMTTKNIQCFDLIMTKVWVKVYLGNSLC